MAISLKHSAVVAVADDPAFPVGSDEWNAEHVLTLAADRLVGRLSTSGTAQELSSTDITTLLAGATFSAAAYAMTAAAINAQTGTTYTLLSSDNGKVVTLTNAAAITVTCPSGLGAAFSCALIQMGAGKVGLVAGGGATLNGYSGFTHLAGQYAFGTLIAPTANNFVLGGQTA